MQIASFALLFAILVKYSHQKSTPESNNYVAAVVEFSAIKPTSSDDPPVAINAVRYVSFVEKAAKQNADIIVFPECGLTSIIEPPRGKLENWTTLVPAPSENYNPCDNEKIPVSETLKLISCAAKDNAIYVVVNLIEKFFCNNESCPSDRRFYYNTNVVFDRDGKIIARYRKTNLFMEDQLNVTAIPEIVTFETDFGVTFGTFTCFDILFKKPAMYLTRIFNVTDIVFPTAWFSEVPFLTALQTQAGWSYAEDANLLVAGYNRPKSGNSGSGIYLGRQGVAKAIIPNEETSEILIAEVPKKTSISSNNHRSRPSFRYNTEEADVPIDEKNNHRVHDELRRKRNSPNEISKFSKILTNDENHDNSSAKNTENNGNNDKLLLLHEDLSSFEFHELTDSSFTGKICHNDFCCDFNIDTSGIDDRIKYRIIVYDGTRTFYQPITAGIRVCAVVLCGDKTTESCGNSAENNVTIDALTINVTFPNYEDVLVMTSSIDNDLLPLDNWAYVENWENEKLHVFANLSKSTRNIVTCGIYARDFSRDSWGKSTERKIGMQWATLTALAIVSIFLLFLYRKGWRKPWQRGNSDVGPYQNLQPR